MPQQLALTRLGLLRHFLSLRDKSHRPKALPKLLSPKWSGGWSLPLAWIIHESLKSNPKGFVFNCCIFIGTIFWGLFPVEVSCLVSEAETSWDKSIFGFLSLTATHLSLKGKVRGLCSLEIFFKCVSLSSSKSRKIKNRIAEKEVREDEKKINIFVFRLVFMIHISYIHWSFKSSKLNLTTVHLWAQGRGRDGSRGQCATAAAQREPV